jgi:putative membrane protein
MLGFLFSAAAFALGLLLLAGILPGIRVDGFWSAFKAAVVCGVLSVVVGKVLLVLLTLIFFLPIVVTGPIGVFVVQALVNAVLLWLTEKIVSGLRFERGRTVVFAAFALTLAQVLARGLAD